LVEVTVLTISNLSKSFAGQLALDRVDLEVAQGEVHALVGQNGSGKSTLIKVLAGYHQPDEGASATLRGEALELGSATAAHRGGIRFVHQDLGMVLELSAVENLMLGRGYPRGFGGRIQWSKARDRARAMVERAGLDIDVRRPVGELGLADRTGLAIARARPDPALGSALLVLDEPTAALPNDDVHRLFETVRHLQAAGNSILIVSHHLEEIFEISDRITVLRDGKRVATTSAADADADSLVRLMVGHDLVVSQGRSERADSSAEVVLDLEHVAGDTVRSVSVQVRAGEVVGVAGLTGSGREQLAALVTGRLERTGRVSVRGREVDGGSPAAGLRAGLALVPGERGRYGIFANFNVRENLTLGALGQHTRHGVLTRRSEAREAREWIESVGVVTRGTEAAISSLSGGNQQKVLVIRALRLRPAVLVLDDPTAGIDVKARDQVHTIVEGAVEGGMSVLLVSTDSGELARLADRVLVMRHGRVVRELHRGDDLTAAAIDQSQVAAAVNNSHQPAF
jgi:ribose transport system ATP-binding protein